MSAGALCGPIAIGARVRRSGDSGGLCGLVFDAFVAPDGTQWALVEWSKRVNQYAKPAVRIRLELQDCLRLAPRQKSLRPSA